MRIVVDVMGGDHGCAVVIEGVKQALALDDRLTRILLCGDQPQIEAAIKSSGLNDPRVSIVHATEVVTMEDKPTLVIRRKKDSSMGRAIGLVESGDADAVISLGNTGAILAYATLKLRPIEGVERAGIATVMPGPDNEFVMLDAGANTECKPIHLLQYAVMGSIYSREILGYKTPRVGVLSNGTEEGKGNELTREAFKLCKLVDINFIGYVEGYDLFSNQVDVVVCDGFVGNIVLKTCEGLAKGIGGMLKRELRKTPKSMLGAFLAKDALGALKKRMDPDLYGCAPLLGLNGIVMKSHGSAKERSILSAIRITTDSIKHQLNKVITTELLRATERLAATETESPANANA